MTNRKPRLLCMVDLSGAREEFSALREVANVDCFPPSREHLHEVVDQYDALWIHVDLRVDKEILDRAKRLRVINTASTGTDHIDVEAAHRRGIKVLSITRDYGLLNTFTATAECAWMLVMSCQRHFRAATAHALNGLWKGEQFCGRQLAGQTLGVLGIGRLGSMTCRFGTAFRMRVLGCDLKPFEFEGVEPADFPTLLRESDVISIHIHMTPDNYRLFGDDALNRMRPGSVLVNTSRGDIIDELAVIRALNSGKLSAFGADVVSDEWRKDMAGSPLIRYARDHENVIITPHIGGNTTTSLWRARQFSAVKLLHYLRTGKEKTWE